MIIRLFELPIDEWDNTLFVSLIPSPVCGSSLPYLPLILLLVSRVVYCFSVSSLLDRMAFCLWASRSSTVFLHRWIYALLAGPSLAR